MRAELVEVDASEWDAFLAEHGIDDAYLLRGYVEASCRVDGGRPVLLQSDEAAFACSVRPIPDSDGLVDVTTPYGYGGPLALDPHRGARHLDMSFWDAYQAWCAANGVVSTFVRFHPLFGNHELADATVRRERLADTIAWPFSADLFAGMHPHHRRVVRKAEAHLEVVVRGAPDELDDFAALYEETMRRRDAADFYFFPPDYWAALARLGDRLVRFDALADGELVASILCLDSPLWLHYHLGASSERARSLGAMHLLHYRAACWGQKKARQAFHLGARVGGGEDSLFD